MDLKRFNSRDRILSSTIFVSHVVVCFAFLFVSKIEGASKCIWRDVCSCTVSGTGTLDDGKIISLWDIDGSGKARYTTGDDRSTLLYNPCTTFTEQQECKGVLACQIYQKKDYFNLGTPDKEESSFPIGSKDVVFRYTGSETGQQSSVAKYRTLTVSLVCDQQAETAKLSAWNEDPQYTYAVTLTSKCACPGVCRAGPSNSKGSGSNHRISTGTILCIVLIVVTVVYLVGGILINKYGRKLEGSEVIPNKEFWKDTPLLVKDGAVFTWRKIRRKEDQYEKI